MKPRKQTIQAAIRILDGITTIARHEQLVHGTYVSEEKNDALAKQGALCGGHYACLLGSAALATPGVSKQSVASWFDLAALLERPSLRVALEALDAEAKVRIEALRRRPTKKGERAASLDLGADTMTGRLAEAYFEEVLHAPPKAGRPSRRYLSKIAAWRPSKTSQQEVISLCKDAKKALRKQLRAA